MIITFKREQQLKATAKQAGFELSHLNNLLWTQSRHILRFTKEIGFDVYFFEIYNTKGKELEVFAGVITPEDEVFKRKLKPTTNFKDFLEHLKYTGLYLGD